MFDISLHLQTVFSPEAASSSLQLPHELEQSHQVSENGQSAKHDFNAITGF